jgi:GNAT superfamily N-acetyltransferase
VAAVIVSVGWVAMTIENDLLAAYDAQLRRWVPDRWPLGLDYEMQGAVLRVTGQHRGFIETARDIGVESEALDALIERNRDFFSARGEAVEWKTRAHDLPTDLPDRLLAAGFVPEDTETVVIGETARMAEKLALPEGIVLRCVDQRSDFDRIAEMQTEVWGKDFAWLANDLEGRVASAPDEIVVLVAEDGGRVVSAAWLVLKPGTEFAGLWGGSTVSVWRGRGIYKALVARRARFAQDLGVKYLQVDASEESRPILQRLGFRAVTTTTPYVWTPASQ